MIVVGLLLTVCLLAVNGNPVDNCEWGPSFWCVSKETASKCGKTEYCSQQVWKNNNAKPVVDSSMVNNEDLCLACEFVLPFVMKYIDENSTEQEVETVLTGLCDHMPAGYASECKDFVKLEIDELWIMIKEKATTDMICQKLKMCTSTRQLLATSFVTTTTTPPVCKMCDFIAKLAVMSTQSEKSKDDVEKMLNNACEVLKPVKPECEKFVEKYFNIMWEKVTDKTQSSESICAELFDSCPKPKQKRSDNIHIPGECLLCKTIEGKFVDEDKVVAKLTAVCKDVVIPADVNDCTAVIVDIFKLLWKDFNMTDSKKICQMIGLCKKSSNLLLSAMVLSAPPKVQSVQPKQVQNVIECEVCKILISYLTAHLSNKTENESEAALKDLCNILPSKYKDDCTNVIDEYFPQIWKLFVAGSGDICNVIGLCSSAVQQRKLNLKPKQLKDDECSLCKTVTGFLKSYMNENTTEAEAKAALDSVCNLLPSAKNECISYVNQYLPVIWPLLDNEMDVICVQIGLCNSSYNKVIPKQQQKIQANLCDECKLIVLFLKSYVDSNTTEKEAQTAVERLCSDIGGLKNECISIVDQYFPMIWSLLQEEVDSGKICALVKLCPSATKYSLQQTPIKKEQSVNSIECTVCTEVMQLLITYIENSGITNATISVLEGFCNDLPVILKGACVDLVDTYGPEIINALENKLNATAICDSIGLCQAKKWLTTTVTTIKDGCNDCEELLNLVKSLMTNDPQIFKNALDDLCELMPSAIKEECADIVNEYEPELASLIAKSINPQSLCKDVKLCSLVKKAKLDLSMVKSITLPNLPRIHYANLECDGCVQMFEEMEVLLPKKKEIIVSAVSDVCSKFLPGDANDVCQMVCELVGDQIVDDIANRISPRTDCKALGICKTTKKSPSLRNPFNGLKML